MNGNQYLKNFYRTCLCLYGYICHTFICVWRISIIFLKLSANVIKHFVACLFEKQLTIFFRWFYIFFELFVWFLHFYQFCFHDANKFVKQRHFQLPNILERLCSKVFSFVCIENNPFCNLVNKVPVHRTMKVSMRHSSTFVM